MSLAPEFNLREAERGEGERILPCYEWLFAPPGTVPPDWRPDAALGRLENALADSRVAIIVAESAAGDQAGRQAVVGLCSVYIDIESVRYGLRGWVEDLAVSPAHRSGGVGAALLRAARGWAKQHGATHLELDSGIRRVDAHRFYERLEPDWTGLQYAWRL